MSSSKSFISALSRFGAAAVFGALVTLAAPAAMAQFNPPQCKPCEKLYQPPDCRTGCDPICVPDPTKEGTLCRAGSGDVCDPHEYCDSRGFCPGDESLPVGAVCRPSGGTCDVAETCKRDSQTNEVFCPADAKKAAGTSCRSALGSCDVAEVCDGSSSTCPADAFKSAATECRAASGACDVAETCSGTSGSCPADAFKPATAECRASAGACDVADKCSGTSASCPSDQVKPPGVVCREPSGSCDVPELCTGAAAACPNDQLRLRGYPCRPGIDACDLPEVCTGSSGACPADAFQPAGAPCRSASGACDAVESCSGSSAFCPADGVKPAGAECRGAAGVCDVAESCDGSSKSCPADAVAPTGTACADDGNACTVDACNGAGACAHTPAADSDADGTCDGQDPCTNLAGAQSFVDGSKSKLVLTRVNTQTVAGDDGLVLAGTFDLPATRRFSDLALDASGARLVLEGVDGSQRLDVTLEPGAYAGRGTRGWTRSRNGKTWTYQDKTGAPLSGIVKLQAIDKSKTDFPTRTLVKVTGKKGTYPVVAADVPLAAIVTLGGQADAAAGLCGESAYEGSHCTLNRKGDVILCKR